VVSVTAAYNSRWPVRKVRSHAGRTLSQMLCTTRRRAFDRLHTLHAAVNSMQDVWHPPSSSSSAAAAAAMFGLYGCSGTECPELHGATKSVQVRQ
jgi:hypothetical protein